MPFTPHIHHHKKRVFRFVHSFSFWKKFQFFTYVDMFYTISEWNAKWNICLLAPFQQFTVYCLPLSYCHCLGNLFFSQRRTCDNFSHISHIHNRSTYATCFSLSLSKYFAVAFFFVSFIANYFIFAMSIFKEVTNT